MRQKWLTSGIGNALTERLAAPLLANQCEPASAPQASPQSSNNSSLHGNAISARTLSRALSDTANRKPGGSPAILELDQSRRVSPQRRPSTFRAVAPDQSQTLAPILINETADTSDLQDQLRLAAAKTSSLRVGQPLNQFDDPLFVSECRQYGGIDVWPDHFGRQVSRGRCNSRIPDLGW